MVTVMAFLTPLLLSLWVCVTVSTEVALEKRIIGGVPCGPKERLYHVQLLEKTGKDKYEFMCGGSLISNQWILTAAHCWEPKGTYAVSGVHPSGGGTPVEIKATPEIFKDYDEKNNERSHDIMLLKLPNPTKIQPVPLPDCKNRPKIVKIAGHAATTGGPNDERQPDESPTLQCAEVDVVDCKDLVNTLKTYYPVQYRVKAYQHWLCIQRSKIDMCKGDSGGGVVHGDMIYGVISFTGDPKYVCREAVGFMDLCNAEYNAWIHKTIA